MQSVTPKTEPSPFRLPANRAGRPSASPTPEPACQKKCEKNALKGYVSADKDYWRHGIGLYVCHQIITAHGGKIWLKSKEGEGTQVFFSLPEEES